MPDQAGSSLPPRALLFLAAVLAEYLLISFLVDAKVLLASSGWWSFLGHSGMIAPLGIVAAAGVLLLGRERVQEAARVVFPLFGRHPHRYRALVLHALAYLALLLLSRRVFDADHVAEVGSGEVLSWSAALLAWLASMFFVALPFAAVRPLLKAAGEPLALGLLAGVLGYVAGIGSGSLWRSLGAATVSSAAWLLSLSAAEVVVDLRSFEVGLPEFSVIIDQACSGYEGVGLILALVLIYLWLARRQLLYPQALLLPVLAISMAFVANVLRITALVLIGARYSEEMALGGFHSKAGWVLFSAIALLVVGISRRSPFFSREPEAAEATAAERPVAAHLSPLLAITATGLLTGLLTVDFDVLRPLRVVVGVLVLALFWRQYHFRFRLGLRPVLLGVAAYLIWIALEPAPDPEANEVFAAGLAAMDPLGRGLWILFRVLSAAAVVPIAEELAFRGFLERRIVSPRFTEVEPGTWSKLAVLGSALAFGLLHRQWLAGVLAGVLYSLAQRSERRLEGAIVAHAVTNGLLALQVLALGHWHLWS